MTRTENPTTADSRSTTMTRAHCNSTSSCRCGQQLDLCAREHCPRCGRSLSRR